MNTYKIDFVEIYTPMAKALAYWHTEALGFTLQAVKDIDSGFPGISSYVVVNNDIRLVLTAAYPTGESVINSDVSLYILKNYCGVKRVSLQVDSVKEFFAKSIAKGAVPIQFPSTVEDADGSVEEASIKLYDNSEICFINRKEYRGIFRPGYKERKQTTTSKETLNEIDHIASEVRINEINFWTNYLTNALGTDLVQSFGKNAENTTGMILNINQSKDKKTVFVMAEPENYLGQSKVQKNIDIYGPGIHHIAFSTNDLVATTKQYLSKGVEFVSFPSSYYNLLRINPDFDNIDIDTLEQYGILIDKEDDTFLLQKFIKPISDRPFFIYELVERVNGYNGFALKNINVLKKAEEQEVMKN